MATTRPKAHFSTFNIIHYLQCFLLHIPNNRHVTVITIRSESETHLINAHDVQNSRCIQLYSNTTLKRKRYLRDENRLVATQIVTRVQDRHRRRRRILRHQFPKSVAKWSVHRRRNAADDGAGVDDRAGGEGGGGDRRSGECESGDFEAVEGVAAGDGGEWRVFDVAGGGRSAEVEVADGAGGGREAVGEDLVVFCGGLLDEGDWMAAEAEEAGDAVEETLVVLAAAEEEVVDDF